ncbi:MAG: hypothetical protein KC713_03410, partial [Candidatus Omnitrophica bacterium]|nr:hypothetical protein [Candidatus Omnitrophota bacterium]
MPEIMIKDQLKKLVDIQKIDEEIYQLNTELTEKPVLIAELKDQFESTKTHLNELDQKAQNIQLERKDIELTLKTKEDAIAKANTQLSDIKTNKEYQAKITEIEGMKADKSVYEDKILESYDRADEVKGLIDIEKKKVDQEEQLYLGKKKEVDLVVAEIKDRIKVLEGQRNQLLPEVDKMILDRYEKILRH